MTAQLAALEDATVERRLAVLASIKEPGPDWIPVVYRAGRDKAAEVRLASSR
jgi:hypothetical protein